ncbi:MAG: VanZ family protein [Ardenticatenaceae bacterium]
MKQWLKLWGPSLLLMAIIFFLSSQSDLPSPPDPLLNRIFKKSAHAIGYGMLAISYAWALAGSGVRRVVPLALFFTILYAISDEWHQTFVPNRFGSPLDVLIDTVGASLALYLWPRLQQPKELKSSANR